MPNNVQTKIPTSIIRTELNFEYRATAVKAAPTPLPSNTVLRTNSESKPRCPEQPEAYTFTLII